MVAGLARLSTGAAVHSREEKTDRTAIGTRKERARSLGKVPLKDRKDPEHLSLSSLFTGAKGS